MAFCKNCGYQLAEDERFCANCGTPVQAVPGQNTPGGNMANNGGQQYYAQRYNAPQVNIDTEKFKLYLSEAWNVFKLMFFKPLTSVASAAVSIKKESAFALGILLSIVYGLLNIFCFKMLISHAASSSRGSSAGIFDELSSFVPDVEKAVPWGKVFLISLLLFLISVVVIFVLSLISGRYMFKSQASSLNILKVCIAASIPYITYYFIQILVAYISITFGFIIGFIGIMISVYSLFNGMIKVLAISENKVAFIMPIIYLVTFYIDFLVLQEVLKSITKNLL